jgi:hypothetical protein
MRWGWLTLLLLAAGGARAGDLFDDDTVLEATLSGPVSDLVAAGAVRTEYPFVLVVDGTEIPVKVRARGNSRLRVCAFPPLRLNFSKQTAAGSPFEGQDKLKLVTHCSDKRRDAGNVFDEYLAYRLFEGISDASYRTRMLRLSYSDSSRSGAPTEIRDAFLIESDEGLAKRLDTAVSVVPGVYLSKLDEQQAARVYVFQYLVGNTDWSLVTADTDQECCHNIDLFERAGRLLPVPYDFDLSGLVNASYAKPDPGLKIPSVRVRRYRGYCLSPDALENALQEIRALAADLLRVAAEVPAASDEDRQRRLDYLGEFFEEAADGERLLQRFEKRCL